MFSWFTNPFRRVSAVQKIIDGVNDAILTRTADLIEEDLEALKSVDGLAQQIVDLQAQVSELQVTKSSIEEKYARRERELQEQTGRHERELDHKIGLLKIQTEAERSTNATELENAKVGAQLDARQDALAEKEETFAKQMSFITERFESEVRNQREQLAAMTERLPTAEILAALSNG